MSTMDKYFVDKTQNTPYVSFDHENGELKIAGKSIPENTGDFYYPIYDWLKEYADNPASDTTFTFQFEYLNSGSSKCILEVFRILAERIAPKSNVKIVWYYEDEDESMLELGEHYESISEIPFEYKSF